MALPPTWMLSKFFQSIEGQLTSVLLYMLLTVAPPLTVIFLRALAVSTESPVLRLAISIPSLA
ncbi:hypothetical protein D3C81_2046120 [compost metagenome]